MERLHCENCQTSFYSSATLQMLEGGIRCPNCGQPLVIDTTPPEPRERAPDR